MDKITRFQNLQISKKAGEAVTGFFLFKKKTEKGMVNSCSICKKILLFGCLSLRRESCRARMVISFFCSVAAFPTTLIL